MSSLRIDSAQLTDIDELLKLYFIVYGNSYPIQVGTDPKIMADAISAPENLWLVMRDEGRDKLVGSVLFETDRFNRIGKIMGLVVHPEYRKRGIANALVAQGTADLLGPSGPVNSVYTTTRTISVSPQLIFFRDAFHPLGIFPNAHRLDDYETLTLFAKFKEGVLARREPVARVPEKLLPIYSIVNRVVGASWLPTGLPARKPVGAPGQQLEFEMIFAPDYVHRRFLETFTDPYDRFYPFHTPNMLWASRGGEVEIFAYLSKPDRYCTIVALTQPFHALAGRLKGLLLNARDHGVSYLELLIGTEHSESIESLLDAQFLPSAIYPAMTEVGGKVNDFVLMTRTMEPLNFRGMAVEKAFKPYVDQYVDLWKKMHLDTLEVLSDRD